MKSALCLMLLLIASPVSAQDPVPPVPDVSLPEVGETLALERNDRAPWAGMLVRDEDLFGLQTQIVQLQMQATNAATLHAEILSGRTTLLAEAATRCDERVATVSGLWRERRDELARALAESREREGAAWYEHPALWFAIGAVVTGALGIGIAAGLGEI